MLGSVFTTLVWRPISAFTTLVWRPISAIVMCFKSKCAEVTIAVVDTDKQKCGGSMPLAKNIVEESRDVRIKIRFGPLDNGKKPDAVLHVGEFQGPADVIAVRIKESDYCGPGSLARLVQLLKHVVDLVARKRLGS